VRILHVAASYLPAIRYGGTIASVHGLCRALARRGHDIHVFTTSVDGPVDSQVAHGVAVDIDGVKVWYFRSPAARRLYWSPGMRSAFRLRLPAFEAVHLHGLFLWPIWAGARAALRAGVPYVVAPRGMLERQLIQRRSRWLKSLSIALADRRTLEGAAAIHVTSGREQAEAEAFHFRLPPFYSVPNGVDPDPGTNAGAPSDRVEALIQRRPYLLFLGRLSWKKRLEDLIAALPATPGVTLIVAGSEEEDGYQRSLEALARRHQVGERVCFAGTVVSRDKAALLRHAAALVLPSYSENFGNVVLEAMAAGCPVVVSPDVGLSDVVAETGAGLVVPADPAVLGPRIAALMADPQRRRDMSERGRIVARERFSWDAAAERMESVYQQIAVHGK
jgi:glycosyltransferase involved in cell wall biosynthesis